MLECRLAQYLNRIGVDTHLLTQYGKHEFDGENQRNKWIEKGIANIFFLNSNGKTGLIGSLFSLFFLLRRQKYDVVITTNSGLDTLVGITKLVSSFKHVIAFHTYINTSILKSPRIKLWLHVVKKANAYYSITDYVKHNINETLKINPEHNSTIYNSIDGKLSFIPHSSYSIRESFRLPVDAKLILVAGRIESRKGFDLVLTYFKEILETTHTYLVIVGEGYQGNALEKGLDGFALYFQDLVKKEGLKEKVLFTGYRNDLQQLMKQGDIYVHLARHEGFGLVLLEAIAAKLPVLASDVGGIPEVLKDTPYKTFALEDVRGIQHEGQRLLNMGREEREVMVNDAFKVLSFYTDERRGSEIKQLLERLIK